MIVQIIILLLVGILMIKLLLDLMGNKISNRKFVSWSFIWLSLGIIVIFPGIVFFFAELIGIERARDLSIYISIIILFYLLFKIGTKIEKIDQEITQLVKKLALEKHKK